MDSAGAVVREPVSLTPAQERALGVVYMQVSRSPLEGTVRTVGRIEASEARVSDIAPKIDGFVEHLHVATTGETVTRGQSLVTLYSPTSWRWRWRPAIEGWLSSSSGRRRRSC